jgi:hypothetical protein
VRPESIRAVRWEMGLEAPTRSSSRFRSNSSSIACVRSVSETRRRAARMVATPVLERCWLGRLGSAIRTSARSGNLRSRSGSAADDRGSSGGSAVRRTSAAVRADDDRRARARAIRFPTGGDGAARRDRWDDRPACNIAGWILHGTELLKQIEAGNHRHPLARELAARRRALDYWRELRDKGAPCASDAPEAMSRVEEAGFLAEYVRSFRAGRRDPPGPSEATGTGLLSNFSDARQDAARPRHGPGSRGRRRGLGRGRGRARGQLPRAS